MIRIGELAHTQMCDLSEAGHVNRQNTFIPDTVYKKKASLEQP